jgi:hypothetical protein
MSSRRKQYAKISWCAEDVQVHRPEWSVKKCNAFLEDNEDYIQNAMVETGNHAIEWLLPAIESEVTDATS